MNTRSSPAVSVLTMSLIFAAAVTTYSCAPQPERDEVSRELMRLVEELRTAQPMTDDNGEPSPAGMVTRVYERRHFRPVWTSRAALGGLVAAIREVESDGLTPHHYNLAALDSLEREQATPASEAKLDLLATDALVRVSNDLRFGRADPNAPPDKGRGRSPFGGNDPVADLVRVASGRRVHEDVVALRPDHYAYTGLRGALAHLRRMRDAGEWESIPSGRAIRLDSTDPRIPMLRRRLAATGYLSAPAASQETRYDSVLQAAVHAFQSHHSLNADGIVDSSTLAELNVPLAQRIDGIRVNLERGRWILHGVPDTSLMVNVAGAMVHLLHGDTIAFETRAIVGEDYTRTPVFSAPMATIDLNPTWTVPPGIVDEILANIQKDPEYLRKQNMRVLDKNGRPLDPAVVDVSQHAAEAFPYTFRQQPGPTNALGRIKFMFPNRYNVYLHDTPSRALFEREERLFSHGCIRVQHPLKLAEYLLADPRWTEASLEEAIKKGRTQTIKLKRKVPVLVLYWTAFTDPGGILHFYRDVYGRDAEVLAALNAG